MATHTPSFPRGAAIWSISADLVTACLDLSSPDDQLLDRARRLGLSSIPVASRSGRFCITVGEVAEAVTEVVLVDLGYQLVGEVGGRGRHGVDVLMLDPAGERLVAIEVKGTVRANRWPRIRNQRLRQMSAEWLDKVDNPGMTEWTLGSEDVYGAIVLVNLAAPSWKIAFTADFTRFAPVTEPHQLVDLSWLDPRSGDPPTLEPGTHPPRTGSFSYPVGPNLVHAAPATTGDPFAAGTASWNDPLVRTVLRLAEDNATIRPSVKALLPWAITTVDGSSLGLVGPAGYSGPGATGLTGNLGHRTRGEAFAAELIVAACLVSRSWASTDGTVALGPTRDAARVDFGIKLVGAPGGRRTIEADLLVVDDEGRRRAIDVKHSVGAYRAPPGPHVLAVAGAAIQRGEIDSFHYVATGRFRPAVLAEIAGAVGVFAHEAVWPTPDMLASIDRQQRQRLDMNRIIRDLTDGGSFSGADASRLASRALCEEATTAYEQAFGAREVVRIDLAGTTSGSLFDSTDPRLDPDGPCPRVVAAWTTTTGRRQRRDRGYLRGFPLPMSDHEIDRGHLIAWSAGGADDLGVNLIPQDRRLNRGRSAAGKLWRHMESAAAATPGTFVWVRAIYDDMSDLPCVIERLQVGPDSTATFARFVNRPDVP